MTQDAWREMMDLKLAKSRELDHLAEISSNNADSILQEKRWLIIRPWVMVVMLVILLVFLAAFSFYAPYLQRRNMILKFREHGQIKVGNDVPGWINQYLQGELNEWFPVIYDVHLRNQEVPDYLLDFLAGEKSLNHLGFSNCKINTADKLKAFASLPKLKWLTIINCQGTDFKEVSQIELINPKLNVNFRGKTFLGVMVNSQTLDASLIGVDPGSPAEKAGLKPGDVIKFLAGEPIKTFDDLLKELSFSKVGEPVMLKYERNNEEYETQVMLAPWPVNKLP